MVNGQGYLSVGALCFFSTLTGIGSCCSFGCALKMGEFDLCFSMTRADGERQRPSTGPRTAARLQRSHSPCSG